MIDQLIDSRKTKRKISYPRDGRRTDNVRNRRKRERKSDRSQSLQSVLLRSMPADLKGCPLTHKPDHILLL